MSENRNYNNSIPSKRLKEALERATAVLGRAAQDALFYDLELDGITFRDASYTLNQINDIMEKVFGDEGTMLLMERLKRELR